VDAQREIERLLATRGLRSADRANLRRLLAHVRKGGTLNAQQREDVWAYRTRYRGVRG
jgi:hypothetical protein